MTPAFPKPCSLMSESCGVYGMDTAGKPQPDANDAQLRLHSSLLYSSGADSSNAKPGALLNVRPAAPDDATGLVGSVEQ